MSLLETTRRATVTEWRKIIEEVLDRKSKNCLNCGHFDDRNEICMVYKMMPPPKIAVNGCERWEEQIPF